MITGSLVAIATPMHPDGSLDYPGLQKLIDFLIAEGTDGIVVVGTTGESPTVSVEEHCELIRVTVEHAAGRIPVMAGTGANSTAEAIELARFAKKAGAQSHLSVVPYYNRPSQEGLYRHFRSIAEAVDLPMVLYNVPGRTVADLANDTALRLAEIPNIIGIKDATGNIDRARAPWRGCRWAVADKGRGVESTLNTQARAMGEMDDERHGQATDTGLGYLSPLYRRPSSFSTILMVTCLTFSLSKPTPLYGEMHERHVSGRLCRPVRPRLDIGHEEVTEPSSRRQNSWRTGVADGA